MRSPDPRDLAVMKPDLLRHDPGAPVRALGRLFLGRHLDDFLDHLGRHGPRAPAPRPVFQALNTLGFIPVEPSLNGRSGQTQPLGQLVARQAARSAKHDLGSLHLTDAKARGTPNAAITRRAT